MDRISNESVVGVGAGPVESSSIITTSVGVSWGGVFAGALVSLGVWILLHSLGIAVGLIAIDPDYPGSLRGVGIGTGIWSMIAPLVALFVGGMVTGRISGAISRIGATIHGAVLWSLSMVLSLLIMVAMVSAIVGGVQRTFVSDNPAASDRAATALAPPSSTAAEPRAPVGHPLTRDDLQTAEDTGQIMLGMFFVMLLGLASSILGSVVAEERNTRRISRPVAPPLQPSVRVS